MSRYEYTAVFPSGARYAITKSAYDGWWSCSHAHRNGGAGSLAAIRRNVEDWGGSVERKIRTDYTTSHIKIYDQKSSIPTSVPLVDPNGSLANPSQDTSP